MTMQAVSQFNDYTKVADYRVTFGDCDPMRVMYYGNYFRLFEIGRAEFFRQLNHPFPEYVKRGLYLVVVETGCRYIRSPRYDDLLTIRTGLSEVGRAWMRIEYEILDRDANVMSTAFTTHAVIDDDGRVRRLPSEFRKAAMEAAGMTPSIAAVGK